MVKKKKKINHISIELSHMAKFLLTSQTCTEYIYIQRRSFPKNPLILNIFIDNFSYITFQNKKKITNYTLSSYKLSRKKTLYY